MIFALETDQQHKSGCSVELTNSGNCILYLKSLDGTKEINFSLSRSELDDLHALSMNRRK